MTRLEVYANREALMVGLAGIVAEELSEVLSHKGHALLAVPGGSTPKPFLEALSEAHIDWARVYVVPTDERCVENGSDASNERLIRDALIQGRAARAQFIPLWHPDSEKDASLARTRHDLMAVLPIDVAVVGMGADLHAASLFSDAPQICAALAEDAPDVLWVSPPSQAETRVTLTVPPLQSAPAVHVLLTGAVKRRALDIAAQDGPIKEAPVRAFLRQSTVHYAD